MMRDYAKVAPQFWTGHTGRKLRGNPDLQIIAMYLMTCPSSSMTGIYYLPIPAISFETGIPAGRVRTALKRLETEGVAMYDEEASLVFVPNMARYQVGESLKTKDNRIPWIVKELYAWKAHPFARAFWRAYEGAYHLGEWPWNPLPSPFEAPSDPLRSQEKEKEQEQEQDPPLPPEGVGEGVSASPKRKRKGGPISYEPDFLRLYERYPRKDAKSLAFEAWVGAGKPAAEIESRWTWQLADYQKRERDKVPMFATYLNQRRWEDSPPAGRASVFTQPKTTPVAPGSSVCEWHMYKRDYQRGTCSSKCRWFEPTEAANV